MRSNSAASASSRTISIPVDARFLLDLAHEPFLERLVVVDAPGGHLHRPRVVEDEQLASTRHVPDDALAEELVDEVAAEAPDLGRRVDIDPAARPSPRRPGWSQVSGSTRSREAGRSGPSGSRRRRRPHGLGVGCPSPRAPRGPRLLDGLALLDPAARTTALYPGSPRSRNSSSRLPLRVLAGDVGDDGRARSQLLAARILALCSRFFAW